MAFGVCTNCLSSFPPSTGQKREIFAKKFDIVTTHNDMICRACFRHFLCVFHPIWVWGGGSQGGRGATCWCSFTASAAQKWKFLKQIFFYILTIQKHQISHVKDVLAPLYVVFTLFGCWGWVGGGVGGFPSGLGHNLLMHFSSLGSSNMEIRETGFFDTMTIQNDQISHVKHVLAPLWGNVSAPGACRARAGHLFGPVPHR